MARNPFQTVRPLTVGRSVFDLSHRHLYTCDAGQLIPVMAKQCIPGDVWRCSNRVVVRLNPMIAPIMSPLTLKVDYFFVPNRILDSNWETIITGGKNGTDTTALPRWVPTTAPAVGTLWDYLGYPVGVIPDAAHCPLDYKHRAYYRIWDEYYRNETLDNPVGTPAASTTVITYRRWQRDYFTSCLPWQQRGVAPAFPISGTTSAVWSDAVGVGVPVSVDQPSLKDDVDDYKIYMETAQGAENLLNALNDNEVDLSSATTFDVAALRLGVQTQKWLERNARAGYRYTEQLQAHYGVHPRDDRLDRPEYLGGTRAPVIISEVLQTSSTDATTPQGNLAGHGLSASYNTVRPYHVLEHGVIMALASITTEAMYSQGMPREDLYRSRYDFPWPEFAHLSEQAVEEAEVYCTAVEADNAVIFGYQGRYDEHRVAHNLVTGLMRPGVANTLAHWHLSRYFASAPSLNTNFLSTADTTKRYLAVPSQPAFMVDFGNLVSAIRPLPIQSDPGLMDHF